ncbi:hypothetical protein [Zestomonas carbonaria]|uniref:Uncharacterized protein n=1 Tax=Zestomonas carbonaria TaxID=2762745 RepID=A0A7U7EMT2_9GAMM|nr:hypothetical protein [Pseudomonas carbonaria]CAD5107731.1 hypothetical protein PSEWESI4_02006 [Pseudomonas carbonaria]
MLRHFWTVLFLASLPVYAAQPGSPGTPTPTPFGQPVPYQAPRGISPNHPPLLNNGNIRQPTSVTPNPRDQDLPLLKEQLRRNSEGIEPERPKKRKE